MKSELVSSCRKSCALLTLHPVHTTRPAVHTELPACISLGVIKGIRGWVLFLGKHTVKKKEKVVIFSQISSSLVTVERRHSLRAR